MIKMTNEYKAIVIGGSAGSFKTILNILYNIPVNFKLPIIMVLHRLKHIKHGFKEVLSIKSNKPVYEPYDMEVIKDGNLYLAPANYHIVIKNGFRISLSNEEEVNNSRPSIDITFNSASSVYKNKLIGILLSGANKDGAEGMKNIKDEGGLTIVQHPDECLVETMSLAAIKLTQIDHIYKGEEIIEFLAKLD